MFSRNKHEKTYTFSDHFNKRFGKDMYRCIDDGTVVAKNAKTINYRYLTGVLKSKDESEFKMLSWAFEGEPKFLYGDSIGN